MDFTYFEFTHTRMATIGCAWPRCCLLKTSFEVSFEILVIISNITYVNSAVALQLRLRTFH